MTRRNLTLGLAVAFAFATAMVATSSAHAWGSWGSRGSSGGSWGSSGGSSGGSWGSSGGSSGGSWGSSGGSSGGSWGSSGGSSGGSWGWRRHRRRHYYSSHGSSGGSWGSSGGSSGGSWGSYGSSGGSHGSSGGVIIESPAQPAAPSPPAPAPEDATRTGSNSVYFTVTVPADAKVMINGKETTTAGESRTYVSRGLQSGRRYKYEIVAQAERDGQTVSDSKTLYVSAGDRQNLDFAFDAQQTDEQIADDAEADDEPAKTTLKLRVPPKAEVTLSGRKTQSKGPVRLFTTTQLAPGQVWSDYVVRAELDRDGKRLSKEIVLSLKAGETREVSIDFDAPISRVASLTP